MNRTLLAAACSLAFLGNAFCQTMVESGPPTTVQSKSSSNTKDSGAFRPLIDNWEAASFGGDGAIEFRTVDVVQKSRNDENSGAGENSAAGKNSVAASEPENTKASRTQLIEMATGDPLTGIRWTGPLTRDHYELRLQARRVEGFDFFVAVTFPVGDEHCSFVVGGWGGGILGISSIDGNDAANNETTQFKDFKTGQWYAFRIRVEKDSVKCWIDDEEYVNVNRDDHSFDIRIEMDPCLPLGIANFQCVSEIKGVEIRKLSADAK